MKYHRVVAEKARRFQRDTKDSRGGPRSTYNFTWKEAMEHIGENPVCYLTGRPIDIDDGASYQFDHKIPIDQDGPNTLQNLGVATTEANVAKGKLNEHQFISLCYKVVINDIRKRICTILRCPKR